MNSSDSIWLGVGLGVAILVAALAACGSSSRAQPTKPADEHAAHRQPTAGAPPNEHAHGRDAQHSHHDHQGPMHHRFENAEQWAKVFDDPARDSWQQPDKVIAALELSPAMTVADVGAGTGYFAVRLARAVPKGRVIATDIEPDMVRFMRDRFAKERIANAEAKHTPPDDPQLSNVDRILVVDVWHHLNDRVAYAKQLASGLRAGGWVVVVDFTLEATHGPPKQHRLPPEAIIKDLQAAGLDAAVKPVGLPDQYVVVGKKR